MSEKLKFEKPALSIDEKVQLLKKRWLIIEDEENAKHDLVHIWYYRLSGYFKYFQEKENDNFKAGSNFQNVIDIYKFDRKLRLLTIDAIEKIEISLKANINDYMSLVVGINWYYKVKSYFLWVRRIETFWKLVSKIKSKKEDRESEIVNSFFEKYDEEFLPSWMLFEELTIWEIATIYKILHKDYQQEIVKAYKAHFEDFWTWIVLLNRVRNICAHHSRLWNKNLNIKLKSKDKIFENIFMKNWNNEVISNFYNSALIINFLLKHINKNFWWVNDLEELFNNFPWMKEKMWFNEDWRKEFEA